MTPDQEAQFDAVHAHVPKVNGLESYLDIEAGTIGNSISACIIKHRDDPSEVAAHAFRLGTIMGYLYAQKEMTANDKRSDA